MWFQHRWPAYLSLSIILGVGNSAHAACIRPLTVAVDTGHSARVYGATSARGKPEFAFNQRFVAELVGQAAKFPQIRIARVEADGQDIALRERPRRAAAARADVFLSFHHDAVNKKYLQTWVHDGVKRPYSDNFEGYSLFISDRASHGGGSKELATLIGREFSAKDMRPTMHHEEKIPGESREVLDRKAGVYAAPFAVLVASTMPAVLVELGVIVHRDEEARLEQQDYRAAQQLAILNALVKYCEGPRGAAD
jgi:N-acetylmuramoyl-L-alanine amidase